ncbi:MAG: mucoidy inhibitor MuiA family protein [Cocleimonas sp.]
MIKQLSSVAVILALSTSLSYADQLKASSQISAVTIYPGSAKVIRNSKVAVNAGKHSILISNLPLNIMQSSLRIAGKGKGKIVLGSVELQRVFQHDVVQEKEKHLREQIKEVHLQRKVINDSIHRNKEQLGYIKKMVLGSQNKPENKSSSNSYTSLPLEQWQQAWQTLDNATASVQEKIRESEKRLSNEDKKLNTLNRQLSQIAVNQKESLNARLYVEADQVTELSLKLSYQINGARWEPVYDADLNTETGEIELKTLAQISQRTGEDWSNVDVTLSTLRPSAGTQLPPLESWSLDFSHNPMRASKGMFSSSVSETRMVAKSKMASLGLNQLTDSVEKKANKEQDITPQQSRLIATDFSAEYHVPEKISLNSGSNKRRFSLSTVKLQSKINLASAPRFDPRVMIVANTRYSEATPLIAGSVSLSRNGEFVGNSYLPQKLSGEELKLSFGEDSKVSIKFKPNNDKKRRDGILFGTKKVVERRYKIDMHSNHKEAHDIVIYDVLPVASDEDIRVKKLGQNPNITQFEDKEGVVGWSRKLEPAKDMSINYGYSVSYPEDRYIQGL